MDRHEDTFADNPRMNFQLANVRRKSEEELSDIAERVDEVREKTQSGTL